MSGKAALVTGGAGGIGLAIATRLMADGFAVVIADRNAEAARKAAETIGVDWRALDIADEGSIVETVGSVARAHGGLAAVVSRRGCGGCA